MGSSPTFYHHWIPKMAARKGEEIGKTPEIFDKAPKGPVLQKSTAVRTMILTSAKDFLFPKPACLKRDPGPITDEILTQGFFSHSMVSDRSIGSAFEQPFLCPEINYSPGRKDFSSHHHLVSRSVIHF